MSTRRSNYKYFIINPFAVTRLIICKLRSLYYTSLIDEGNGQIKVLDPWLKVSIRKSEGGKLIVYDTIKIKPYLGGNTPIIISLGRNSKLIVIKDFVIGNGVKITIHDGAELFLGGRKEESASGITADVIIMVYHRITIGYDFICAWDVFISDSDWHCIKGQLHHADIDIGNHVWIAHNSSILKGTKIGDGSVVASHTKTINGVFPEKCLIAGTPAVVVKRQIEWSRDLQ